MKRKLTHNLGLKLLSVVLACMLWFLVAEIGDPLDTKYYSNISVRLTNTKLLEDENKVYEVLDNTDTVRVSVTAPRSIISNLRSSDIIAEADISKLTDINTIAISYRIQNVQDADIDGITGDHEMVRLSVEDRTRKWIRLNYTTVGEVAEGYVVTSASPDQTQIEVSGPKSIVDQISYAYLEMDVAGATTNTSANISFDLYNKNGVKMDQRRITKNVDNVHMSVEVLATKEVPIELKVSGEPADGYLATGVTESSFSSVKIAGSSYALSNINRIVIPEEDLDITDAEETVTKALDFRSYLPENIKLVDAGANSKLTVSIFIEPIEERELEILPGNLTIINVPEDYTAQLDEPDKPYILKISGLADRIMPLQQNNIYGSVDIAAWMNQHNITELSQGAYDIPVTFTLNESISQDNEIRVRVLIERVSEE
ncbi:MAG: CdaR family protein [Roseburia sp.]|nr:CdaR family protein [Roseburia sp.]